jgi:glycosyltransferase involved in cell wall biosynthesis
MAAGLPVVSSRAASLPEVLGDVGVGVDPDDSESWVLEIYALLDNKERREELSYQGIAQARRFSWTRTGRTTLNAYEEFCEGWNTKT